jgi:ubiquinone/menaquinone biosynthesis C-methylase UbiE
MSLTQEKVPFRRKYWVRLTLFLGCAVTILIGSNVAYQALTTLNQLDAIEAERDHWQRPTEVIQALNLKNGDSVVDLGCGSGYFALRLSDPIGRNGRVIAEDIRRLSLTFLWMRAVKKGKHNVSVHLGDLDDPHLPPGSINAVLISNTYHEFTTARSILEHVRESLVSGGRLVIIDRSPKGVQDQAGAHQEHEISSEQVASDLKQTNFVIDSRTDRFIESDPDNEGWWMIVAHRP